MGRPRKKRKDLPERVYFNHGAYFFVGSDKKWISLGRDYPAAMRAWALLIEKPAEPIVTVNQLLNRYQVDVLPYKGERTQQDNLTEMSWLRPVFGEMSLRDIRPHHIASYRDSRAGKVRANREIALLSHALNKACEWGLLETNPCAHVKRNKEAGRTRYIEDDELTVFRSLAPKWLQLYIDLKNLIALRQQDMLVLKWEDFAADRLDSFMQKVSKNIRIVQTEEITEILDAIPRNGPYLFPKKNGEVMTGNAFKAAWTRVRVKYLKEKGITFTEHDIRGKVATDMDDIFKANKLLGHSSIQMTEDYIKQRKTDVAEPLSRRKK